MRVGSVIEALPVAAVIERDPDARLGAGIEQAAAARVFPDRPGEFTIGDAVRDLGPALPLSFVL
ncbi:MAG: hypothetical protein R2849_22855 [Thermomicrobiales bacterium]